MYWCVLLCVGMCWCVLICVGVMLVCKCVSVCWCVLLCISLYWCVGLFVYLVIGKCWGAGVCVMAGVGLLVCSFVVLCVGVCCWVC